MNADAMDALERWELDLAAGLLAMHRRRLRFVWRNADNCQVRYGSRLVAELNYDDHGSAMGAMQDTLTRFATLTGVNAVTVGRRGR